MRTFLLIIVAIVGLAANVGAGLLARHILQKDACDELTDWCKDARASGDIRGQLHCGLMSVMVQKKQERACRDLLEILEQ